jgi:hypothetical protein
MLTSCNSSCHEQIVVFGVVYPPEVLLEFVRASASRADRRHQIGHPLGLGQGQEVHHFARREPDEVQGALPTPYVHVFHLPETKQIDHHANMSPYR